MKFIAYILSLYILLLATAPGVKAMYAVLSKQEQKVDCCSQCSSNKEDRSSQKEKGSSEKNTRPDNCNPFEACNACIGYTVNLSPVSISILPVFYADKPLGTVQNKLSNDFSADFWQPPRLG